MIFLIMTFVFYLSTVSQDQKKSIYTSCLRLFLLLQFVFTKYIHTYLIDKYIMLYNDEIFMLTHAHGGHKRDASQTEREERAGL